MKVLCLLILSVMLPAWTLSACGKGTLKCEASNVPSICDFTENYVLNGENCEVKVVDGCEIASFDSSNAPCFLCEKGKVLDENSELCVAVEAEKQVTNCFRYDKSSSDCVECDTDFYLSGDTCNAVGNIKVANCAMYSSITQCKLCDAGYYLVGNECVEIEKVPNCRVHSNRKCVECEENYFMNLAYNSNPMLANVSTFQLMATGAYSQVSLEQNSNSTTVCQKVTVKHCLVLETASKCKTCMEDYFLTESELCQRFPEPKIDNCLKYTTNKRCEQCADTHYVKRNVGDNQDECVLIPTVENCAAYNKVSGFCETCEEAFWLDSDNNSCVARKFNPPLNCAEINPKADQCSRCNDDSFVVNDLTGCYKKITGCKTHEYASNMEAGTHVCKECEPDFFLQNQTCLARLQIECMTWFEDRNACKECKHTHYISESGDNCTPKNIPGCAEYTDDDKHTCETCENLKYPTNSDADCSDISANFLTNCYKSDGKTDACSECNAGILKTAGGECTGDRTNRYYDQNCGGNTSQTDDDSCASCAQGYVKTTEHFISPAKTQAEMDALNCRQIADNGTDCKQCKDNFYLTGTICNADGDPSNSKCLRTTPESTQTLLANAECEECKPGTNTYLTGGVCTAGLTFEYTLECEETHKTEEECAKCTSGNYPVDITKTMCGKETVNPSILVPIPKCVVRADYDKCRICEADSVIDMAYTTCETTKAGKVIHENNFDVHLNQIGSLWKDEVAGCIEYTQLTETDIKCTRCDTSTVGIVDTSLLSPRLAGLSTGNAVYNFFSECADKTLMYKDASGNEHVGADDCLIGERHETNSGYGCLRCKNGMIGTIGEVTQTNGGVAFVSNKIFVFGCTAVAATDPLSDYLGVSQAQKDLGVNKMALSTTLPFSNCPTSTDAVFYIGEFSRTSGFELSLSAASVGSPNKMAYCGAEADKLNDLSEKVENCAMYGFASAPSATFNPASDKIPSARCISCRPGFYISKTDDHAVLQCSAIHGCNTDGVRQADENSYLNGCSNPDSKGWKADSSDGPNPVNYADPMPNSSPYKIDKCKVLLQNEERCLICEPGFNPQGSICADITEANSNCTTKGIGQTGFEFLSGMSNSEKNLRFVGYYHVRQKEAESGTYSTHLNSLCNTCSTGTFLLKGIMNINACGKRVDEKLKFDHVAEYGSNGVSVCDTGFSKNVSSGKCEKLETDENCKVHINSYCNLCIDGYTKNVAGKCVNQNCGKFDGSTCLECLPNFVFIDTSQRICEPNPNPNDECKIFSIGGGKSFCIKCKDTSKIPYNFYKTGESSLTHKCVSFTQPTQGWTGATNDQIVQIVHDGSTISSVSFLSFLSTAENYPIYVSQDIGDPAESLCLPIRTVDNCKNLLDDLVCIMCEDTYTLMDDNTCQKDLISNCQDLNPNGYECDECNESHYLSADKTSCSQRSNSTACKDGQHNKYSDTCLQCEAKEKVMNSSDYCVDYTAENCRVFANTVDECEFCVDSAWMDREDSNKCKLSEDPECIKVKQWENECQLCNNGYFLETNGLTQTCKAITAENCETNETHEDKCKTCKDKFHMFNDPEKGQICKPNTEIDNCLTYSRESDDCLICAEGYYSSTGNTECRKYPTGISNCTAYSNESTCSECNSSYYLKNNACELVTHEFQISDCKTYATDRTCGKCKDDFFLSTEFRCDSIDLIVKGFCKEYESHEKCKSCIDNYILNEESKICEPSGIDNCKLATRGSPNLCQECVSGFFPTTNRQSCQSPSTLISGCLDYVTQTKCSKCEPGHILSLNGSQCTPIGSKAGLNCSSALEVDKLECDVCEFGYVKSEIGECVKISEPFCAFMSGDKCGLCFPKMQMTAEGKCENPSATTPPISVDILKAFTYLFLLMWLVK